MRCCLHKHPDPCPAPDHRPCGPVVAALRLYNGNQVWLCKDDLDSWLDMADDGEIEEPVQLRWMKVRADA